MELKELKTHLETIESRVKDFAVKQQNEIDAFGKSTTETADKIDAGLKEMSEIKTEIKSAMDVQKKEIDDARAELKKRVDELETEMKRPDFGRKGSEFKTIGQTLTDLEQFKALQRGEVANRSISFEIEGKSLMMQHKAITNAAASAGDLVIPDYLMEIFKNPQRAPVLRDLMNVSATNSGMIEYFKETGFYPVSTVLTSATSSGSAVCEVESVSGFYDGQTVYVGSSSFTIDTAGVDPSALTLTMTANIGSIIASGTRVYTMTTVPIAEGGLKPQGELTWDAVQVGVKTLPVFIKASTQILDDVPMLQSEIDIRLAYMIQLAEEKQILWGSGAGTEIEGLMTAANAYNLSWSTSPLNSTQADLIRYGIRNARNAEFAVTATVLNPTDKAALDVLKGNDGHYIMIVNNGRVWGVPIVETTAMTSGRGLTGAFGLGARLFDRMKTQIRIAEQDDTNFQKNLVTIRAEERIALVTYRPEAFVPLTFDNAPAT